MTLKDFQRRLHATAQEMGLNGVALGDAVLDVDCWRQAACETLSERGLRDIAVATMQAAALTSVIDGLLDSIGVDVIHGSLHDLVVAMATEVAGANGVDGAAGLVGAIAGHGALAAEMADVAGGAMDAADLAMHVATGGLSLVTSVAASYLVGRYVEAKKTDRQARAVALAGELARREAYQALRAHLHGPSPTPKELSAPVLILLKAGETPTALA